MNTRLTLLAVSLAAISAPTFAGSALEVYGKVNVTVESQSMNVTSGKGNDVDGELLRSNASRFGIKGDLSISEGFEAFYQLEWEVDPADADKGSNDNIKSRNQIVGLRGSVGTIFAGRHDTPLKVAQNKIDLFNDYIGDLKVLFNGEIRASNLLQYSTPSLGGFKVNAASVFQEGNTNGNTGAADATSISAEWSNKMFYFAVAQDSGIETYSLGTPPTVRDIDTLRAVAQIKLGDFQLGAMYQEKNAATDTDGYLGSVAWNLGDHTLKAQYGVADTIYRGGEQTSVGWDYKLAKNITSTLFYTTYTNDVVVQDTKSSDRDNLGLGLEVKF